MAAGRPALPAHACARARNRQGWRDRLGGGNSKKQGGTIAFRPALVKNSSSSPPFPPPTLSGLAVTRSKYVLSAVSPGGPTTSGGGGPTFTRGLRHLAGPPPPPPISLLSPFPRVSRVRAEERTGRGGTGGGTVGGQRVSSSLPQRVQARGRCPPPTMPTYRARGEGRLSRAILAPNPPRGEGGSLALVCTEGAAGSDRRTARRR